LAVLLLLVLAGVALSPFWALQIASLLPWGQDRAEYAALAARIAAVEARPAPAAKEIDTVRSAMTGLAQRADQLDSRLAAIEQRPAPPSADVGPINSALSGLTRRVDNLEAADRPGTQIEGTVAAIRTGTQQLEQRLGAIETQLASRTASETAAAKDMQQEISRLDKADADLTNRVAVLEHEVQSQSKAELRSDGMAALLLSQMREAVEQARPFPTEFNAFIRLARDSDLTAAAEPLAEAARNGVASQAVLAKRLSELAGRLTETNEAGGETDWKAQTLARLRSLVTIRRIDGAAQTEPEMSVRAAQAALARGDLAGAVAALDPLAGANAEAARPWLQMARERLAVEGALDHLQQLLITRLGSPGAAPAKVPEEPEKTRTRS
jgi:hypothetical protein